MEIKSIKISRRKSGRIQLIIEAISDLGYEFTLCRYTEKFYDQVVANKIYNTLEKIAKKMIDSEKWEDE